MYCPQCATENLDNASFCRGCGSNISLVPQALTGNLPAAEEPEIEASHRRRKKRRKATPSIERGIKNIFMGFAFVVVATMARKYLPGAATWWFWFFIPAFMMIGGGIAELLRFKLESTPQLPASPQSSAATPLMPAARPSAIPPRSRNTGELSPQPPSVTEATTRRLETPVENRPKSV
ncbi:MAG: zinc ribbon domain-containing protein [Pyrinomonadaceae bacterium]|nr:zinc ribbon domain-containing protein [Pyrinomonadaceae bacterium]